MSAERELSSREESGNEAPAFSAEDLEKLFHYPSIGQLFGDSNSTAINDFRSRMESKRDQLEKVVRHGSREEADKAGVVIKSINVTLDFLFSVQQMRLGER